MGRRGAGSSAGLRDQAFHGGVGRPEGEAGRHRSGERSARRLTSVLTLGLCLPFFAAACSDSGGASSNPGPLVDNTQWEPTDAGEELFGSRPPDAVCNLEPIDCDDEYPWPTGECVTFEPGSACVTAYVPECLDTFTVMAVYTRMPNPAEPLCNWLTLAQPSLRDIRAGDQVEIRLRHSTLTAPSPGKARMIFAIGDRVALNYEIEINNTPPFFPRETWTAPADYPKGTQLLFHVDNHGSNEYMLIEVRILEPGQNTDNKEI